MFRRLCVHSVSTHSSGAYGGPPVIVWWAGDRKKPLFRTLQPQPLTIGGNRTAPPDVTFMAPTLGGACAGSHAR